MRRYPPVIYKPLPSEQDPALRKDKVVDARPTPLTDAARLSATERRMIANGSGVISEMVPADFARQLERSNAELVEGLQAIRNNVACIVKDRRTAAEDAIMLRADRVLRNAGVEP